MNVRGIPYSSILPLTGSSSTAKTDWGTREHCSIHALCNVSGPEAGCSVCPSLALSQGVMDPMCQFLPSLNRKEKKNYFKREFIFLELIYLREREQEIVARGAER